MPLPSFLKRSRVTRHPLSGGGVPILDPGVIEQARVQARRRLVGAAILVAVGVIGLPLLFDGKPRPLPYDLPVVLVHGEARLGAPVPMRAAETDTYDAGPVLAPEPPPAAPVARAASSLPAAMANQTSAAPSKASAKPAGSTKTTGSTKSAPLVADAAPARTGARKPELAAPAATSRDDDSAARALAWLEGREPSSRSTSAGVPPTGAGKSSNSASTRYVVQIGAFAEASVAREARMKVERLGIKTYTQVIQGDAGRRIRVRVGPYTQRQEAEQAVAKIKQAGLSASLLTL